MYHRLFAIFATVCLALGGAGCASESQRANREEILMPLQTGSVFQRRVVVDSTPVTKKPKKKKETKETKEKETKRATPKPTPAPEATPVPEEETPAAPERFR
jgi:cell division septation protein DedD